MNNARRPAACALLVAALAPCARAACDPRAAAPLFMRSDYAGALDAAGACARSGMEDRGKGTPLEDIAKSMAAFWLLNRAQVRAVLGDKEAAAADLTAGRSDIQAQFPGQEAPARRIVEDDAALTEAFLAEKSGDQAGAASAYRRLLAAPEADRIPGDDAPAEASARLALLALDAGRLEEARTLAGTSALPSAQVVRAALLARAGLKDEAYAAFQKALDDMKTQAEGSPTRLLHYAEHERAEKALLDASDRASQEP